MKAQEHLKRDKIVRPESKEFAFTKLMVCGNCGSGITAEDKYKKLKDGSTAHYIYYGCGRSKDHSCKSQYVREEDLVVQLAALLDRIDLNESGIKRKLEIEIERYEKFQNLLHEKNAKEAARAKDINLRAYAKYILKSGTVAEKRELMGCFKSKLVMRERIVTLQ